MYTVRQVMLWPIQDGWRVGPGTTRVHELARVGDGVEIHEDVYIGAFAAIGSCVVIGAGVYIGARATICSGSVIGEKAKLGASEFLVPNSYVAPYSIVGSR